MKFVFDENCPPAWAEMLRTLPHLRHPIPHEIFHLAADLGLQGTPDEEWMRNLDRRTKWIILTQDTQIRQRKHEQAAWRAQGLVLLFFGRRPWKKPMHERTVMLLNMWPYLVEFAATAERGTGFYIPFQPRPTRRAFERVL